LLNDMWRYLLGDITVEGGYIVFETNKANSTVALNSERIRAIYLMNVQERLVKMRDEVVKEGKQ